MQLTSSKRNVPHVLGEGETVWQGSVMESGCAWPGRIVVIICWDVSSGSSNLGRRNDACVCIRRVCLSLPTYQGLAASPDLSEIVSNDLHDVWYGFGADSADVIH